MCKYRSTFWATASIDAQLERYRYLYHRAFMGAIMPDETVELESITQVFRCNGTSNQCQSLGATPSNSTFRTDPASPRSSGHTKNGTEQPIPWQVSASSSLPNNGVQTLFSTSSKESFHNNPGVQLPTPNPTPTGKKRGGPRKPVSPVKSQKKVKIAKSQYQASGIPVSTRTQRYLALTKIRTTSPAPHHISSEGRSTPSLTPERSPASPSVEPATPADDDPANRALKSSFEYLLPPSLDMPIRHGNINPVNLGSDDPVPQSRFFALETELCLRMLDPNTIGDGNIYTGLRFLKGMQRPLYAFGDGEHTYAVRDANAAWEAYERARIRSIPWRTFHYGDLLDYTLDPWVDQDLMPLDWTQEDLGDLTDCGWERPQGRSKNPAKNVGQFLPIVSGLRIFT